MQFKSLHATRAFLLVALTSSVIAATAQNQPQGARSSITSFDRNGNAIIQPTSGDPTRSSVTTFDRNGNAVITYTSPSLSPNGIQNPRSVAELIANQNIYGQSAPNPTPGYTRFGYSNSPIFPPGYFPPGYGYPAPPYGYPAPPYGYPAPGYPQQQLPSTVILGNPNPSLFTPNTVTNIPLNQGYNYPAPYGYPAPGYPYPAPYGYPAPAYPYGYGYGNGSYTQNSTGYGVSFGRGGFRASIGGSNTTSRSSTTTTITVR